MKYSLLSSTALCAFLIGSSPAIAQSPFDISTPTGWYVSLFAGATFVDDYEQSATFGGLAYTISFDFDTGYELGIAVGAHITSNLRGEIEYAYSDQDVDSITFSVGGASVSGPISADFEIQTLLFNLWYDIDINGPITPYIGGGIGYGDVEFKTPFGSADDDGFAYQLGAGVKYAVNQQWHLDVGYRFKDILEIDIFGAPLGDDDLQSHSIRAAVTYKFN